MQNNFKLFNFRPIVTILLCLIIGTLISFLSLFYQFNTVLFVLTIFLSILLVLTVLSIVNKKPKYYITLIIAIIFIVISSVSVFNVKSEYDKELFAGNTDFYGEIVEIKSYEEKDDRNYYYVVAKGDVGGKENKVIFSIYTSNNIYVGNKVSFSGYISKNGYVNSEGKPLLTYIINKEFYKAENIKNFHLKDENTSIITSIKRNILISLKTHMPDNYGFSYALLTGDTAYLPSEVLSGFRLSGVAHIFAVSGLHVGFLYVFLTKLLLILKTKRKPRLTITIIVLFLYVAFCGFTPSCMRAFLVLTIISLLELFGLKGDKLSALSLSAIIISLYNPYYLLSVGFILSYVAYLSLILLTQPIKEKLSVILPYKLSNFISPYISAYIGTLPIVISSFGYVSAFAMLFNVIIVPIISVVFILNFIAIIGVLISPYLSFLCVIPNIVFTALTWFISAINPLAFLVDGVTFRWSIILYYLILVFSIKEINLPSNTRKLLLNISIFTFILSFIVINIRY